MGQTLGKAGKAGQPAGGGWWDQWGTFPHSHWSSKNWPQIEKMSPKSLRKCDLYFAGYKFLKMCHASISSFWFSHLHWSSTSQLTSNWEDVSKEEVTFILPRNTSIGSQSNDIKCCIPISKDSGDDIGDAGSSPVPLRRRVNKGIKWKVYLSLRSLCMLRLSAGLYIVIGL